MEENKYYELIVDAIGKRDVRLKLSEVQVEKETSKLLIIRNSYSYGSLRRAFRKEELNKVQLYLADSYYIIFKNEGENYINAIQRLKERYQEDIDNTMYQLNKYNECYKLLSGLE